MKKLFIISALLLSALVFTNCAHFNTEFQEPKIRYIVNGDTTYVSEYEMNRLLK